MMGDDAGALAERILRLLSDHELASTLAERALARARDHFAWPIIATTLLNELERLAARA
jgi:glycosyltransferase involved in cell wall biosynthesis